MRKNILFNPALFMVAMFLPAMAFAASAPKSAPIVENSNITWSAETGLGYDSNAYQAPRNPYIDYALGSNPLVVPKAESGFFVPYKIKVDAVKNRGQDNRLLGSAKADGSFYLGSGLSNANEYNVALHGGTEHVLARKEKSEDTFYVGALLSKHKQVYVDHDSGLGKTTTLSSTDISGRYSYTNIGLEAEYKHRIGKIDYGFSGLYTDNDYEDPVVVAQMDHTYYKLGADASFPVASKTNLNLSFDHSVRDYSDRHARDAQGVYSSANPLLQYSYNAAGATLRNRISDAWLLYLDYGRTLRSDSHMGYGDYSEDRYGARLVFEQGVFKTRLGLHHWARDYPNGFAFDVAGMGAKTYSGNDLKVRAEMAQTKNTTLWTELVYDSQQSTDLRYDYVRTQLMAGMSWAY